MEIPANTFDKSRLLRQIQTTSLLSLTNRKEFFLDIWDAQKDMLADTLGALTALLLYLVVRPDRTMRVAGR